MRADVQKILSRVGSLPPLPDIVLKLQERLRDPEVSLSELSTLVMKDPAFTADILRIANSPFYGLSRPTSSLTQCFLILGLRNIQTLALAFGIKRAFPSRSFKERLMWRHSVSTALFTHLLTREIKGVPREELFIYGLLHDIGKTVLLQSLPELYEPLLDESYSTGREICPLEKELLEFTHTEIGYFLAQEWNLDEGAQTAIFFHHNPELSPKFSEESALVRLGDLLSHHYALGFPQENPFPEAEPSLGILNVTRERVLSLGDRIVESVRQELEVF